MDKKIELNSATFCIFPFEHLATLTDGSILPCCVAKNDFSLHVKDKTFLEAWNSEKMKRMRKDMLAGNRIDACSRCYDEEACGVESHRISSNRNYLEKFGTFDALIKPVDDYGYISKAPTSIDLRISNTCNLQCLMCSPAESSKWMSTISKLYDNADNHELKQDLKWKLELKRKSFSWHKNESFWRQFEELTPHIREIVIGGGEPFMIKEQINFLEYCREKGFSKNLRIRVHTNGTLVSKDLISMLEDFDRVELMVSIDGFGNKNEYIRHPASWQVIERTLNLLDESPENFIVHILSTLHAVGIFNYPDFIKWFISQGFKKLGKSHQFSNLPLTGIAHTPSYLNPRVLPSTVKIAVRKKFVELFESEEFENFFLGQDLTKLRAISRFNSILDYMESENMSDQLPQLFSFLRTLDQTRNTNFQSVFPELNELLIEDKDR